jgi:hypothetical protein
MQHVDNNKEVHQYLEVYVLIYRKRAQHGVYVLIESY